MARYREVGLLAEGGMAVIAQALCDDGATVVIKRVRPPFAFDPSFLRLFADEGAVHAGLEHENIVRLLDRGEDEAGPYLVFEHVDGTDLGVVLDGAWTEGRPLDVECVLAVALPLFKALAFAHASSMNVVHRDVSPGNVLIAADGGVKLADFGVASFALKTEVTVAGEMKGKFAYMAPEQTRGEKVDARADLFAAGVVLWECLAGKKLFDGPTDADVVAAVRTTHVPALAREPALDALVASLLEKDPERRPQSASAVVDKLQGIALTLGLDEGLRRHAARLARTAPRRELQVRDIDSRRRTQRVLGGEAGAVTVGRRRSSMPVVVAAFAVAAVGVALFALRSGGEVTTVTTKLPDVPPPSVAPIVAIVPSVPPPSAPPVVAKPKSAPKRPSAPVAASAVSGVGKLTISLEADQWAAVSIDGKVVAKETPLRGYALPAGPHTVVLTNPVIRITKTLVIEVPPDGDVKRIIDLNQP